MGKEQHLRMVIFEWFAIPSMPLDMASLGSVDLLQLFSHLHHVWLCLPHVAFQEASPLLTTIYITLRSFIANYFITSSNTSQFASNYSLVFSNCFICYQLYQLLPSCDNQYLISSEATKWYALLHYVLKKMQQ